MLTIVERLVGLLMTIIEVQTKLRVLHALVIGLGL